jgi:hypothetical protein
LGQYYLGFIRKSVLRLRRETQLRQEYYRRAYIEKYLPHIGVALQDSAKHPPHGSLSIKRK